jgi:hypothetical protein
LALHIVGFVHDYETQRAGYFLIADDKLKLFRSGDEYVKSPLRVRPPQVLRSISIWRMAETWLGVVKHIPSECGSINNDWGGLGELAECL